MLKYTEMQIKSALTLLNQISTKGINNCQRICMIEQILQNPITEEKDDGSSKKE